MKTAMVTGASGGIGSEIARSLAKNGYDIAAVYNSSAENARQLVKEIEEIGQNALMIRADLTDENAVEDLFSSAEENLAEIDLLVNCAGISVEGVFQETSLDKWNEVITSNLNSVFLCCKRALPNMIKKKSGCIINIGSIWGETGASYEVAYSTSKAAVSGLTKALAKEVSPSGIRVNAVAPGWIDTKMNARLSLDDKNAFSAALPLGRIGTAGEVANAVLFLAENTYITGQILCIDGGYRI